MRSDARFIESQIEGVKKVRDQLLVSILARCPLRDRELTVQSTPSKMDTFGTGTVRLIESQLKGVKKGRGLL